MCGRFHQYTCIVPNALILRLESGMVLYIATITVLLSLIAQIIRHSLGCVSGILSSICSIFPIP